MKYDNEMSGKVYLIAGGGRCYTDVAARFVGSSRGIDEILASPYNRTLVRNIIDSGHLAACEFDYYLFGVEGFSRVTEAQLIRKRLASYMISSGRHKHERNELSFIMPESLNKAPGVKSGHYVTPQSFLQTAENLYKHLVESGVPHEDARYILPQGLTFKGLIGMNAHALRDWFRIRCCNRAQAEIRNMAWQMLRLCLKNQPDLFKKAGPACFELGYCPENNHQCEERKGKVPTHKEVLKLIAEGMKNG